MSLSVSLYSRVEFVSDLGFGERVIAFVEFNSQGINFGIPQHVRITDGTPEDATQGKTVIDIYGRITVHRDGKIVTHWPLAAGQNLIAPWDGKRALLKSWSEPWSMREELIWDDAYLAFTKGYFTEPKPPSHKTCLKIAVKFKNKRRGSVIRFAIVKPEDDMKQVAQVIPIDGQVWVLNGGWPWVLVAMSDTKKPGMSQLSQVGKDYRLGGYFLKSIES